MEFYRLDITFDLTSFESGQHNAFFDDESNLMYDVDLIALQSAQAVSDLSVQAQELQRLVNELRKG